MSGKQRLGPVEDDEARMLARTARAKMRNAVRHQDAHPVLGEIGDALVEYADGLAAEEKLEDDLGH